MQVFFSYEGSDPEADCQVNAIQFKKGSVYADFSIDKPTLGSGAPATVPYYYAPVVDPKYESNQQKMIDAYNEMNGGNLDPSNTFAFEDAPGSLDSTFYLVFVERCCSEKVSCWCMPKKACIKETVSVLAKVKWMLDGTGQAQKLNAGPEDTVKLGALLKDQIEGGAFNKNCPTQNDPWHKVGFQIDIKEF